MMSPGMGTISRYHLVGVLFLLVLVSVDCGKRHKGAQKGDHVSVNAAKSLQRHIQDRDRSVTLRDYARDRSQERNLNKGKICIGTNARMSVPSNREHHYANLKDRFTNCTYVDGNLELTWLKDENLDLSFLQYIREVTGYVLISHVEIKRIVLPKLQIIRGRTLFRMNNGGEEFSLIVSLSKMYTLELPALRDVLSGNIGLFNNYNLCHVKTINWNEIMSDPNSKYSYVYNFTSPERECPPCDKKCEAGCWGEGEENCQKFSKENCSPQCFQGRCFGPQPRECCHLFCAGGCVGPKQSDCIACKNFYDDGVCTQECPPMQIYNTVNYSWEPNPKGKYAYGATCVKNCPEHLLKDNGACVRTCPPQKRAKNGECIPCEGPCPKTCPGSDGPVHSGNIESYRGCTVIEGHLHILENSFNPYQQIFANYTFGERYPAMHPDKLEVFSTLKEVTGFIDIQATHPDFKNLSYFRNLEIIGGRELHEYFSSLYIVKTSLQSLELKSLKKINSGTVTILENKDLCLASSINWSKIRKSKEHNLMIGNNQNPEVCKRKKLVCDDQCSEDGCWGAGPDQCVSCAHFRLSDTCLQNCSILPGTYQATYNECKPCHEECGSSCTGPTADKCTTCKHFKDGPFCVSKCPINKFEENGICKPCHNNCVDGCTGPKNIVGPGGCNSCEKAIMRENSMDICLRKDESCPDGYYDDWVVPHEQASLLKPLAGKAICRKCHPRCETCTGYGFHVLMCTRCAKYRDGEQCVDDCPSDNYPDDNSRECKQCHPECRGCKGPGPEHCHVCQNFKIYEDNDVNENNSFTCVATCPQELPHRTFPVNSSAYCTDKSTASMFITSLDNGKSLLIVACVVVGLFMSVVVIVIFLYCYCRKMKEKENALKMTLTLAAIEDEPLRPTNVMPNVAQLRIIKETEIRKGSFLGFGAFGTVYKGVWIPEGEHNKIPVAIKVLREDTGANTSKEFLEEAYIMATVDHPNLLQLLAVCMTSDMMLVTQLMPLGCLLDFVRNNREKIGSKYLLNWCTQIARGMAYLEEKRLVHRDLAARNVLVQTPGCVKITDFGLAKLLDINEEEYKAAGGKMPIKWLALECIQHRIFTHKSDVWAFGVTVWELLTFGKRPYDNIPARDVPEILEKGERLPQPSVASIDIYMVMIKCWMLDAESRPSFKELVDEFSKMARDPGRYLAIPGDKFMRLQNSQIIHDPRSFGTPSIETSESHSEGGVGEEYLQPKSRAPLRVLSSLTPIPSNSDKLWPSLSHFSEGSMASQYQNNFNQKLLRYSQNRSQEPTSMGTMQSDISKYSGESGKMREDTGSDEYDSASRSQAQNSVAASAYVDIIDTKSDSGTNTYVTYPEFYNTNIDNPEYLMNNEAPTQTVGLPTVPEFVQATASSANSDSSMVPPLQTPRSSEEESDHEYYNDFDRMQRELQPLKCSNDATVVGWNV
ncbi:epidermal growth factor receptor isoform X2 [Coccinella septempunctata]|uniref:epidermal growth factor receptor isoform X2 n=1 Tax=Coccinella septempunctata TaxID=41139 RepID=UPI001D08A100|nr:epidermal growth factor receptor isoform X2 [Coccinella septempunctata]